MAKSKSEDAKVVPTKSIKSEPLKADKDGLVEVTLLKDHGVDKKDDKLLRHPNTAQVLIDRKIAK